MRPDGLMALVLVAAIWISTVPSPARAEAQELGKAEPRRVAEQTSPQPRREELKPRTSAPGANVPLYQPPLRGMPGGRVSGGSRGSDGALQLWAFAPDHTGFTISEQPSVYWAISQPTSMRIELTVVDPRKQEPLLEVQMPGPVQSGVYKFGLADHGVRLVPDVPYRWFVAIVRDPARRSRDILAGGVIQRRAMPEGFEAQVAATDRTELPTFYAGSGFWYDAVDAISERIAEAPSDSALRSQRGALLSQVGLSHVGE